MEKQVIIKPHEGFQERFVRSNVDVVIGGGQLGGGKLNPLYTRVLTPQGWTTMGDLKVGDLVCTPFGAPSKVLRIFEHKNKDIYRVTTSDGRQADCGLEHLWAIRTEKQKAKYNKHKDCKLNLTVCDTEKLIEMLSNGRKAYIPIPYAQEFAEKDLPIPPYVLGVLIGDGCISGAVLKARNTCLQISNTEEDVLNKVYTLVEGYKTFTSKNNFTKYIYTNLAEEYIQYITNVGLNVKSFDKFIPREYLDGSIEQRRELLYGLMDTDGCVEGKNSFSFSTSSSRLKQDFVELCRSLGYIVKVSEDNRRGKYTNGVAYNIRILTNDKIFSSKKHTEKYENNIISYPTLYKRTNDHVYVESIEKIGVSDARCIYIEDDMHLYIVDDYITTHNTFGAALLCAEPSLDPRFRACFLRNNLDDLKAGGGVLDTFRECYGAGVNVVESGNPHVDFTTGARVDVTHIADQTKKKLEQRFKGRQYDLIYLDELTGFTFECFTFLFSRNRGQANWSGKIRATTNPKRNHWLRTFLDWYIGPDGQIAPDRDGVVRYFYIAGNTEKDVVWGDSKEDVYRQARIQIDRFLASFNGKTGKATYKDVIKSFCFYLGRTSENKALGDSYAGSVAAMGGRAAEENSGNWNVDTDEDFDAPITNEMVNMVFMNDPMKNGDKWITVDLADEGTDNLVALVWDGFHVYDIMILSKTTPRENAERILMLAEKHDIADTHIIYDATSAAYMQDYIPEAEPFKSIHKPVGMYGRMARYLKDECYLRLVEVLKRGEMSMSDQVANSIYTHQKLRTNVTVQNEFLEECAVVRFTAGINGKMQLFTKKQMNAKLGKGRSMDLLDPCAMRMLPILDFAYGEELFGTAKDSADDEQDDETSDIYNDSFWS